MCRICTSNVSYGGGEVVSGATGWEFGTMYETRLQLRLGDGTAAMRRRSHRAGGEQAALVVGGPHTEHGATRVFDARTRIVAITKAANRIEGQQLSINMYRFPNCCN